LSDPRLEGQPFSPFQAFLGYDVVDWRPGYAVVELETTSRHLNRGGVVHGAIMTALIDVATGFAGTYPDDTYQRRIGVTLSLTTSFVAQALPGRLRAVGQVKGGGQRIFIATVEVFDGNGMLVAIGEATYRYRSSRKTSGE
jgi:uncharacterized protein (TIGR00369 family)